jgi:hypothetical protein
MGCSRLFLTRQGLLVHQQTCVTKQREREQNIQFEAEIAEQARKQEGMAVFDHLELQI